MNECLVQKDCEYTWVPAEPFMARHCLITQGFSEEDLSETQSEKKKKLIEQTHYSSTTNNLEYNI